MVALIAAIAVAVVNFIGVVVTFVVADMFIIIVVVLIVTFDAVFVWIVVVVVHVVGKVVSIRLLMSSLFVSRLCYECRCSQCCCCC